MTTSKANPTGGRTYPSTATRVVVVSFLDQLESGELLTGSPTVAEISTSDLTIANAGLNTASMNVESDVGTHAIVANQAVQFTVTGGTAGSTYGISVSCGTDGSPAQTLVANIQVKPIAITT